MNYSFSLPLLKAFQKHKLTYLLVLANLSIFLTYGFEEINTAGLLGLGANFAPFSLSNEPYRLVTSMFLHVNLVHLLMNLYSLFYLGSYTEEAEGTGKLLRIYLITGIAAGLASLTLNLFTVSAGASGAIFGLYGYHITGLLENRDSNKTSIIANFIFYLAVVTLVGGQFNFDHAAHFGGAVSGIFLRLLHRLSPSMLVDLAVWCFLALVYVLSPRHQPAYFQSYRNFLESDKKVIAAFNSGLNDQQLYSALTKLEQTPDSAIASFRNLPYVPAALREDTISLIRYLSLRDQQIAYYLKGIQAESYIYLDSISHLGALIKAVPPPRYHLDIDPTTPPPRPMPEEQEAFTFLKQRYDEEWLETTSYPFSYYRLGKKDALEDWHGRVEDYYASGAIQMKGNYHRGLRDGIFIYYSADSTYASAGRYLADNRIGKWQFFHQNGKLASEIRYDNGFAYVLNTWDSIGKPLISNGHGKEAFYYPDGKPRYKRTVKDGLNHGFIESYYPDGRLRFKELHEEGELIKGLSYTGNSEYVYDFSVNLPYPEGGYQAFQDYIAGANHLASDTVEAFVIIRFDVHHTGKVHNIRFLKRHQKTYDAFARKLLLKGPEWIPPKPHGLKSVSTFAEVRIDF